MQAFITQVEENSPKITVKEVIRAQAADKTCAWIMEDCEKIIISKFRNNFEN